MTFPEKKLNGYFSLLLLFPIILFASYIYKHALNVPFMDDMTLVNTVNNIQEDSSRFFSVLVSQQNDHRIAFARLGIIASYLLSGAINFRLAILLGYLNLILLGYSLYLIYRTENNEKFGFLPATLLLFSPIVYFVQLSSITSFQHSLSLSFSILGLYFLQPDKSKYWFLAIFFSIAASLTNLDGISVVPLAIFWLITQRRWKTAGYFTVFALIYFVIYFTNFNFSSSTQITWSLDNLALMAQSFLTVTGSLAKIISDSKGAVLSLILGSFMLSVFTMIKFYPRILGPESRFSLRKLFTLDLTDICFLRIVTSMVMIAIGRFADGMGSMTATRFQVYSVSMVIIFYLFLLKTLKGKNLYLVKISSMIIAIVISFYSYKKYETAVSYFDEGLKADSYNYPHNKIFLHQYWNMPDPDPGFYANYDFPLNFPESTINFWRSARSSQKPVSTTLITKEIPPLERDPDYIFPLKELVIKNNNEDIPEQGAYLGLSSNAAPGKLYLIALLANNGSWLSGLIGQPVTGNYRCEIPKKLPHGTYTAKMCWVKDGKPMASQISQNVIF